MRTGLLSLALTLMTMSATATVASAQDASRAMPVASGDRIKAAIEHDEDSDRFAFPLLEGGTVRVTVKAKRSSGLLPRLRLFRPDGSEAAIESLVARSGTSRPKLAAFEAGPWETGLWTLAISGGEGQTGPYSVSFKLRQPKRFEADAVRYYRDWTTLSRDARFAVLPFPAMPGSVASVVANVGVGRIEESGHDTRIGLVELFADARLPESLRGEETKRKGTRLFVKKYEIGAFGTFGARVSDWTRYENEETADVPLESVDIDVRVRHPRPRRRRTKLPTEPRLHAVEPATVRREDTLRTLACLGQDLRSGSSVSLSGEGVEVLDVREVSDSRIEIDVSVAYDAPLGGRDVILRPEENRGEAVVLEGAFEVLDPDPALDAQPPVIEAFLVNDIPEAIDGSGTYVAGGVEREFDLLLPRFGFELRVVWSDRGGSKLSVEGLVATCSVPVGDIPAGQNLASLFEVTQQHALLRVPETHPLPVADDVRFEVRAFDGRGNASNTRSLTVDIQDADHPYTGESSDLEPFDRRDVWILRTDSDVYSHSSNCIDCRVAQSSFGANGIPDLDEILLLAGLRSDAMTPESSATVDGGDVGTNAIVRTRFLTRFREILRERFGNEADGSRDADSIDIEFLFPGEQGSLEQSPELSTGPGTDTGKPFSELAVGGWSGPGSGDGGATLGRAYYDANNRSSQANLSTADLKLGVFVATIWNSNITELSLRGPAVGEDSVDHVVLSGDFDRGTEPDPELRSRHDAIHDAIEEWALRLSSIAAHEIGHSLGLVPDGAPGRGLFGNSDIGNPFIQSDAGSNTRHHVAFSGGVNIMDATSNFDETQWTGDALVRFHPLIRAYLLERVLYDERR